MGLAGSKKLKKIPENQVDNEPTVFGDSLKSVIVKYSCEPRVIRQNRFRRFSEFSGKGPGPLTPVEGQSG